MDDSRTMAAQLPYEIHDGQNYRKVILEYTVQPWEMPVAQEQPRLQESQVAQEENEKVSTRASVDVNEAGDRDGVAMDDAETNRAKAAASQQNVKSRNQRKLKEDEMYGKDAPQCCTLKCNVRIPRHLAVRSRDFFSELSKKEQDIVLLGYLQAHQRTPHLIDHYGGETKRGAMRRSSKTDDSFKRITRYFYCDLKICRKFFLFLYDLGEKRLKNLSQYFQEKNLTIREHGSKGCPSNNKQVITEAERQYVINFITKYAETYALPAPGRRKKNDNRVVKLPAAVTRVKLYGLYCDTVKRSQNAPCTSASGPSTECPVPQPRLLGRRSFETIWKTYLSHILTA